jgi:hypothetical protein
MLVGDQFRSLANSPHLQEQVGGVLSAAASRRNRRPQAAMGDSRAAEYAANLISYKKQPSSPYKLIMIWTSHIAGHPNLAHYLPTAHHIAPQFMHQIGL